MKIMRREKSVSITQELILDRQTAKYSENPEIILNSECTWLA